MTATEFRKSMFQLFVQAMHGECIEVDYRGQSFQLVPEQKQSKLSRLRKRDALNCPPDQLKSVHNRINEESMAEWERK